MSKIKNELATRCELALMGKVVPCNNDEVQAMVNYILTVIGSTYADIDRDVDIINHHLNKYSKNNKVKYIVVNTLDDFAMISFLIDDEEEPFPDDLATPDGVLCYVYNVNDAFMSEFGYCFFEKREDQYYHRIG